MRTKRLLGLKKKQNLSKRKSRHLNKNKSLLSKIHPRKRNPLLSNRVRKKSKKSR